MEIGLFQLENLTISRSPFTFLDLRMSYSESLPPEIQKCLEQAHKVTEENAAAFLEKQGGAKDRPILLICESGVTSSKLAAHLEDAGFGNVYVIAGGVAGLLSELR